MNISLISHGVDLDGVASALLAHAYLTTIHPGVVIRTVFANYSTLLEAVEEEAPIADELWVLDLGFSNHSVFEKFASKDRTLIFDHHSTSRPLFTANKHLAQIIFDDTGKKCTADLLYEYIQRRQIKLGGHYENLVKYTHSRDLWIRNEREGDLLNYIIQKIGARRAFLTLKEDITRIYQENYTEAFEIALEQIELDMKNSMRLARSTYVQLDEDKDVSIVAAYCYNSAPEVGMQLAEEYNAIVGLMDIKHWCVSFRASKLLVDKHGVDVGKLARYFGGGGHPCASGAPLTNAMMMLGPHDLAHQMKTSLREM